MLHTALVPVNLHERTVRIQGLAQSLCELGIQNVRLLHVGPADASRRSSMTDLAGKLTEYGVSVTTHFTAGSPALAIVQAAAAENVDVIALGWHRKSWLQRTLVGSTVQDIIRMSTLPVLVEKNSQYKIRSLSNDDPAVIYATDLQQTDADVMPILQSLTRKPFRLIIANAGRRAPDPAAENTRRSLVQSGLERLCEESGFSKAGAEQLVGVPSRVIARLARREQANLVVLGKSDGPSIMGSTAEATAVRSPASLLIV